MHHKLSENEFYSTHLWEMQQNEYNDILEKQMKIDRLKIKEAVNSAISVETDPNAFSFTCLVCMHLVHEPYICN